MLNIEELYRVSLKVLSMEHSEKLTMKVSHARSRIPTFVFVVLLFLLFILTYNYWSLSSSNQQLTRQLRLVRNHNLVTRRERDELQSKVLNMENKNQLLENDLFNDRAVKDRALEVNSEMKVELQTEKHKLNAALENEVRDNLIMTNYICKIIFE